MPHADRPLVLQLLLAIHIAAGFLAFACAPVALVTAKGGPAHRRSGLIYLWAMVGVGATALALSLALPIWFLAGVSVFSLYAAVAAWRVLSLKDLGRGGRAAPFDHAAAVVTILSSAALATAGVLAPHRMGVGVIAVAGHPVSIVAVVFGLIGVGLGGRSLSVFHRPPALRRFWWIEHMRGMIISYVAAWTAFSAVVLSRHFGAAWWVWLWPTFVGTPASVVWTVYYRRRFARVPAV